MKKIYLLFIFLSPIFFVKSQTILNEDFEETNFPPTGWTLINGNAPAGYNWARNTDTTLAYVNSTNKPYPAFQGSGSMVYETDVTNAKAWAITPPVSLTNAASYTISFYYRVAKADFPEKLKVTVGNDVTATSQSTILWDNDGGTGLSNESFWTQGTINYTATSTGNFYFGFNCYSDANRAALVIDNIKIEKKPTEAPPCAALTGPANGATNVTAPEAFFTWDSASTASRYIFKLGTTNTPDSIGFSEAPSTYQSDLAYGTTYYWTVVPKNAAGYAAGCPVYSFTTQIAPAPPINDECAGAIVIPAGSSLRAATRSATQSMAAESCNGTAGNANDDVWFKFTASQSNATITVTPDLLFDGVINAYSGSCGSLVSLACADQGVAGETETLTMDNLNAGETYYLRVYGFDNAGKDGSFTLTASGTILPVNLTTFKGEHDASQNVLTWTTQTEQNNKGFELQRSVNGRDFSNLAFINSKAVDGNSSSALIYHFADVKLLGGNNYYRLKQVDKDGKSIVSNIVLLKGSEKRALALSNIYPNPATTYVNVVISAPAATNANIIITDIAGRPVIQHSAQLAPGYNNLSIDVNKLSAGTYFIKVVNIDNTQSTVSKFVKQ